MTGEPETLRQWIGARMRALREQHGQRQDDVARAARDLGLMWSRSKVAALERGDKALPAEELLLLPLVLAEAQCGRPSLADLLPEGSGVVQLGDQTAMPAEVLAQVVRGEEIDVRDVDSPSIHDGTEHRHRALRTARLGPRLNPREALPAVAPGTTSRELLAAERAAGDAERIAARRLGVPFLAVVAAALATWGHGLTEERDARAAQRAGPGGAPARSAQAARGHITRELYSELMPAIEKYRKAVVEQQGEES